MTSARRFAGVYFSDTPNLWTVEVIEHEGELWLVGGWLANPQEQYKTPTRLVCLSRMKHQRCSPGRPHDFLTREPLPKAVLDRPTLPGERGGFVVLEAPDVRVSLQAPN